MAQLTVRNIVNSAVADFGPVCLVRQEDEFGVWVDELLNQPGAGHAIDFHAFSSDPFHSAPSSFWFYQLLRSKTSSLVVAESAIHRGVLSPVALQAGSHRDVFLASHYFALFHRT